jgi:hypothetical protein
MFISLDIQHAKRLRLVVLPAVTSPLQSFSALSHKRQYLRQNVIEYITCVLIFSTSMSETYLILRRTERDMIKTYIVFHVQYTLFFWDFIETWFCCHIFEKYPYIKFDVNLSSGSRVAQCALSGGRTDRHNEANISFSQFCERTWYRCLLPWSVLLSHISCSHLTSGMIFVRK